MFSITPLDAFDGAAPGHADSSPKNTLAPDGRLWFANGNILQSIDPHHLVGNDLPPPVHVESMTADGKPFRLNAAIDLPPNTRDIEIDYTALSFVVPQKVHFRYKLDGWDKGWQEPGDRRQAFYTNLPPHSYTFHVVACNNDGVWNDTGDAVSFNLKPAFYQTLWFRLIVALLCTGLLFGLFNLRLRFVAFQIREQWRVRLAERERIARELHDTFFQGIQGLFLRLGTATRKVEPGTPVRMELEEALGQFSEVMLKGRHLVEDLRSAIPQQNLIGELEAVGRESQNLYSTKFETSTEGAIRGLNPVVEEELSKIGREAISNAFRHANAKSIKVEVRYGPHDLRLLIRDDGAGIDPAILREGKRTGHWGLPGIRERVEAIGGTLRIESVLQGGTTVDVRVPAQAAFQAPVTRWLLWLGTLWKEDVGG